MPFLIFCMNPEENIMERKCGRYEREQAVFLCAPIFLCDFCLLKALIYRE